MNLDDITPLVLTYNEEANLARTLAGVAWARQAVSVDSGSPDGAREVAGNRGRNDAVVRLLRVGDADVFQFLHQQSAEVELTR